MKRTFLTDNDRRELERLIPDSPLVVVTETSDGVRISVSDKNGIKTALAKHGFTPVKGVDYVDGRTPVKGVDYVDGYTPQKGVDYYTNEEKQALVADIMDEIKSNVKPAKIGYVTLLASSWVGADSLYSQIVSIEGVTEYSQVDLTPSVQQLAIFYDKDLSFVTENDGGVVTVYAIGQKPTNDYNIQVTITEVDV